VTQKKIEGDEAKIVNGYIARLVKEVHKVLAPLEPDTRFIILARVQRDTAEQIQSIENAAFMQRKKQEFDQR